MAKKSAGDSLVANGEALRHRAEQAPEPSPQDLHNASELKELIANVMFARTEFFKRFMEPDSRRNVAHECGYPEGTVDIETYQGLYDREPIPNRAMTLLPKECWQVTPEVYEDEDEEKVTPFEKAWQDLGKRVRGLRSWRKDERGSPVWEYLKRIDMQSGIGHFGLLLLGFDDVKTVKGGVGGGFGNQNPGQGYTGWGGVGASYGASTLLRPVPGVIEAQLETDFDKATAGLKKRKPGAVNLNFLRVYPESLVQILNYDQDRTSPRYGHPETYMITVADPREMPSQSTAPAYATENVHWTRVIHVADNLGSSEWSGVPRGQSILNRLLDTRKLYAASAEGFWQSCFAALSLETHPQLGGDVIVDQDKVRTMMSDFRHGLQRYLTLMGMSAKTLAPQVVDPSPQIERQIEAICIQLGCPVRIFKGSERGELASSQDDQAWNDRLKERQDGYITPRIIEPFVDRLIAAGVLPVPDSATEEEIKSEGWNLNGGYKVKWPDLTSKSDQEKATVALTKTQAIAAYVAGGAEAIYPPQDFLTRIMGEDQKDAAAIIENANEHADEQATEAQALADEHGMIPEAPPGFQHPEPPPPPPGPIKVKPGEKLVTPKPPPTTNEEDEDDSTVTNEYEEVLDNVFCATGPGGGINPHCSTGGFGSLNTPKGLTDYIEKSAAAAGFKLTPLYMKKMAALNPNGLQGGTVYIVDKGSKAVNDKHADFYMKTLPAGTVVISKRVTASAVTTTLAAPSAPTTPTPAPATPLASPLHRGANVISGASSTGTVTGTGTQPTPAHPPSDKPVVLFQAEKHWETGKAEPGTLNGVDFKPAPPKFWEKTKDVDIKEPKSIGPIARVGVMITEPDGRVWICQPTNGFGNRKFTIPGGGVEKGLTNQQNALKEVWEETGLHVKITGHLGDFKDSNNGNNGRLYVGVRVGGAPWDAKVEPFIIDKRTNKPAAESSHVSLVTKERAAELLHRTDDLAQLATVAPIKVDVKSNGEMMKKIVDGVQPKAKQYEAEKRAKNQDSGSSTLHAVQELRGFNGTPTNVSKVEMDKLVASGTHIEMLRGLKDVGYGSTALKASTMADQFRNGDHFPGFGCFGNGTYADSNKGSANVAGSQYAGGNYGGGGAVLRIALPKSAKIVEQSELEKKVGEPPANFNDGSAAAHAARDRWLGVQAALAGYDAIRVDGKSSRHYSYGKGYYVILNRSVLTVQTEDAKGHVIK